MADRLQLSSQLRVLLGQTVPTMSGLPPIATELRTSLEVRFVPIGDMNLQMKPPTEAALILPVVYRCRLETAITTSFGANGFASLNTTADYDCRSYR